jgi:multisubunit Na+/H+ antiporter MnhG subunit
MSDFFIDTVIYILFIVSVGFSGIGIIGLLLFPDIRSRLYTAVRATLIGTGAMVLSVIVYAFFVFQSGGGDLYTSLVIHTLVLMCIVIGANLLLYRLIRKRAMTPETCKPSPQNNSTDMK